MKFPENRNLEDTINIEKDQNNIMWDNLDN